MIKLLMIWFVVSFAFSEPDQTRPGYPFGGLGLGRTRTGSFVVLWMETRERKDPHSAYKITGRLSTPRAIMINFLHFIESYENALP